MEKPCVHHANMLLKGVSVTTRWICMRPTHLKTAFNVRRPVTSSCHRGRARSAVTHRRQETAKRGPGAVLPGVVRSPSSMVKVTSDRDDRYRGEHETTSSDKILRHCRGRLSCRVRVKSDGGSSSRERKSSRDGRNGRHDSSMDMN